MESMTYLPDLHVQAADQIDGWYPRNQLEALHSLAASFIGVRGPRFLEIGTWKGRSARVLAPYGKLDCIDTWAGIPEKPEDPRYQEKNVLEQAKQNLAQFHVEYHQGNSKELLKQFPNATFNLIHIDGDHRAPTVESDVLLSWALLKRGGILCGDDFNEEDVYCAVMKIPYNEADITVYGKRLWVVDKPYQ